MRQPLLRPADRLILIVGAFGSGKSEAAVNLALYGVGAGRRTRIADLDIVNPYFRSREARARMEERGVGVVVPPPSLEWADLPIIPPEVLGMLQTSKNELSILDVGGNDVGARVLSSLRCALGGTAPEVWQVVNPLRPFTRDREACLAMQRSIEKAARLPVTGLLVNSHLLDETTPETVLQGYRLARSLGSPIRCVAVMERLADSPELREIEEPLLVMRRHLVPPWLAPAPAAPPHPFGRNHGAH